MSEDNEGKMTMGKRAKLLDEWKALDDRLREYRVRGEEPDPEDMARCRWLFKVLFEDRPSGVNLV